MPSLACTESTQSEEASDFVRLSNAVGRNFEGDGFRIISWAAKQVLSGVKAEYIADRDIFKLTYFWKERSELDYYRQRILNVGSSLFCLTATAKDFVEDIKGVDAEWHRSQSWALENEYLDNIVRVDIGGEEFNGVVWGWLPAGDPCNIENHSRWMIRLVDNVRINSIILDEKELVEAVERHARWKGSEGEADNKMFESPPGKILDVSSSDIGSAPVDELKSQSAGDAAASALGACGQESSVTASVPVRHGHDELGKVGAGDVVRGRSGVYEASQPLVTDSSVSRIPVRQLNSELKCPICLSICRSTHTVMECLHRFCQECIEKHLRLGHNECPKCRVKVSSRRALRPDPRFDGLIRALYPDIDRFESKEDEFASRVSLTPDNVKTPDRSGDKALDHFRGASTNDDSDEWYSDEEERKCEERAARRTMHRSLPRPAERPVKTERVSNFNGGAFDEDEANLLYAAMNSSTPSRSMRETENPAFRNALGEMGAACPSSVKDGFWEFENGGKKRKAGTMLAPGGHIERLEMKPRLSADADEDDETKGTAPLADVEPHQVYLIKFHDLAQKLQPGPPLDDAECEHLMEHVKHKKPCSCARFGVLWAIAVAGPDFVLLAKKELVGHVLRAILAVESGWTLAVRASIQYPHIFMKKMVAPWQRAMQQSKTDHRHRVQDVLQAIVTTKYSKEDTQKPGLMSVLEFLGCKEGRSLLDDMQLPKRAFLPGSNSRLFADNPCLEESVAEEAAIVKALGNLDMMKSSSLEDDAIDMSVLPVPKWPAQAKVSEIHPFNPVFIYVFTDMMGYNKEVHKTTAHSINLPKLMHTFTLDDAFKVLLPEIPPCPGLARSAVAGRPLLHDDVAAYVSYLIWMASRRLSNYLDGQGGLLAMQHYSARKATYAKALRQKPDWLLAAVRSMVALLAKTDGRGGGHAGDDDEAFEIPDL